MREAVARGAAHIGNERDVHELMHAAGRSDLTGWEQIRDGMWTRPLAEGIRAVIRTSPLKGTKYQLLWGLSLAWVPHLTSTGTSLHRTAKAAHLGREADARAALEREIHKFYLHLPDSHTRGDAPQKLEAALERTLKR